MSVADGMMCAVRRRWNSWMHVFDVVPEWLLWVATITQLVFPIGAFFFMGEYVRTLIWLV